MAVLKIKPTPKGEGGSKVVANPTLTGDEQNLQGLEVEGTKYKVSGGSEDSELILGTELLALKDKHLSVDKLIALIQKYDVDNTDHNLEVGISTSQGNSNTWSIVWLQYQSGLHIRIVGTSITDLAYKSGDTLTTILTNNKVRIENFIIEGTPSAAMTLNIFLPVINGGSSYKGIVVITKQEILDLFVD